MWGFTTYNEQTFMVCYFCIIITTIRLLFIYCRLSVGTSPSFGPS